MFVLQNYASFLVKTQSIKKAEEYLEKSIHSQDFTLPKDLPLLESYLKFLQTVGNHSKSKFYEEKFKDYLKSSSVSLANEEETIKEYSLQKLNSQNQLKDHQNSESSNYDDSGNCDNFSDYDDTNYQDEVSNNENEIKKVSIIDLDYYAGIY